MIEELKAQSDKIGAYITCENCTFHEPASDYFDRDDVVDEEAQVIDFGCPGCGSDSVLMGKEGSSNTVVVNGLDELWKVGHQS